MKKFWEIKNKTENEADLYIYAEIGESFWGESVSASSFKEELDEVKNVKNLNIYINSGGGSVFDGLAIYNMLKRHEAYKTVYVDGLAASIASVIALAGNKIIIPENAFYMIHLPSAMAMGNAEDFRKMADTLDQVTESILGIYMDKVSIDKDKLLDMMTNETWMSGVEAKEHGFADEVISEKKIAACISSDFFNIYKKIPENLIKNEVEEEKPDYSGLLEVYKNKIRRNEQCLTNY